MKPRPRAKNTSPRNAPSRFSKFLFARFCAAFFFFFFFFFSFYTLKRVKVLSLLSFRQSRVVVLMGENDNFILSIFDSFFVSRKKQIKMKKRILDRERKKERKKERKTPQPKSSYETYKNVSQQHSSE
tara:strand:+ start:1911 stop:2294 length:384 start_codon:yes stop_codon:yes gene_type:complete